MSCPFCNVNKTDVTAESECFYAKLDGYPVTEGHTLIISKRHVANYFDLTEKEQVDMVKFLNAVKKDTDKNFITSQYNVGVNCGELAGQTVGHVHIHLIPRRQGDVDDPRGGVRWVIANKAKYWKD